MKEHRIRFGLIGVGRWGRIYIRTLVSLEKECVLSHLCTRKPENAALVPYPVPIIDDWRNLVRSSDCDAVIIATPPATHAEILEGCIEAGKPCIVEKPLCMDIATAERLCARIESAGVPVLIDHTHLFNPAYQKLREMIRSEKRPVRFIMSEGMNLGPFRRHTSALWDWCPHDFSLCFDLMEGTPARLNALVGPRDLHGHPELVDIALDYPDKKATALIRAGRMSPHKKRTFTVFTSDKVYEFNDMPSPALRMAVFDYDHRYEHHGSLALEWNDVAIDMHGKTMDCMIRYFMRGLHGERGAYFQPTLGMEIVRWIGRCEQGLV